MTLPKEALLGTPLYFGTKLTGLSFAQNLFIRYFELSLDVFNSRVIKSDCLGLFKKIFITAQVEVYLPIRLHADFLWENLGILMVCKIFVEFCTNVQDLLIM